MYTHRPFKRTVRDGAPRYGAPVPSEEFAGAGALQDLGSAPESEIPLILARYAALRAWELDRAGESPDVLSHALSAALDHLDALADRWTEKGLLRAALLNDGLLNGAVLRGALPTAATAGLPGAARAASLGLLLEAAARADSLGHAHGARALRQSVHRDGWWREGYEGYTPPSLS